MPRENTMVNEPETTEQQPAPSQDSLTTVGTPARSRFFFLGRALFLLVTVLVMAGFIFTYRIIFSSEGVLSGSNQSFFEQLGHLIVNPDKSIRGESTDRINILLAGVGGANHPGGWLADTIILASVQPSTGAVALLSIPRDLAAPIPGYDIRKINNAFAFGFTDSDGSMAGGATLLGKVVTEVTGQPIHYWGVLDFSGFRDSVDELGGITVTVDRSFVDHSFPTDDYGYQTVSFTAGEQVMDGTTALDYVRSRHGSNDEGSDFARATRQQKVLVALKKKIFSIGTLLNPGKISELSRIIGDHTATDLELWEMLRLAKLVEGVGSEDIVNVVLDTEPGGLLTTETGIDGAYLLVPRVEDFSQIQELAATIFRYQDVGREDATVEIQNGTTVTGLAQTASDLLADAQLTVTRISNAAVRDATETIIYDLSGGTKPNALGVLTERFGSRVSTTLPTALTASTGTTEAGPNFLVVLGQNAVGRLTDSGSESVVPTP